MKNLLFLLSFFLTSRSPAYEQTYRRISSNQVELFSNANQTNISARRGSEVSIKVTGKIRLGAFAGMGSAATEDNADGFIINSSRNGQNIISNQSANSNISFSDFEKMLRMSESSIKSYIGSKGFAAYTRSGKMTIYIRKDRTNIEKSEFIYFGHIRDSQKIRVVYTTDNERYSEKMFNDAFSLYKKHSGKLEEGYYWCTKPGKVFLRISPTKIEGPGIKELYPWEFEFSDYYD